jgi:hypothetical protein
MYYRLPWLAGLLLSTASAAVAQAPAVVRASLAPAANARAASRTTPVGVPFSQAIDPATANNIRVFSQQYRGRRTATAVTSGSTVALTPTVPATGSQVADFRPGETVFVTVPNTVQSAGGVGAAPYVYQFTAAAGGYGAFGGGTNPSVGSGPTCAAVGDVDGDGDLDMLVSNSSSGTVSVRLNDGAGGFAAPATNATVTVGTLPNYVALGDVDNDGDLDFVTANYNNGSPGTVSIRFNNGAGFFTAPATPNLAVSASPSSVALGDVDGDGDLDLLVGSYTGAGVVVVLLNDGTGSFSASASLATGARTNSVALGDVDGDGDLDFVATSDPNSGTGSVSVRLNNGQGSFTAPATNPNPATGARCRSVALGDVDGDGDLDFVAANYGGGTVSVRLNDGTGNFTAPATNATLTVGTNPNSVTLGDVDGDGDLDLLTANSGGATASVLLNDGAGSFAAAAGWSVGTNPNSVTLGDVDGDGDLDLLTASNSTSSVSVRLNAAPNVAPTALALSNSSVAENAGANAPVGTFSTTDPNAGDTFAYALVSGTGSTDNGSFNISGSTLRLTASADYETKSSYAIRVRTTDQGGLSFEQTFTVSITDVLEPLLVSSSVSASGAGTTWATAYKTLQEALAVANANSAIQEIWIKAGTYYPTAYPIGTTGGTTARDYAFALKSGLAIYGGFAGTETAVNQRVAGNTTILSGDIGTVGDNADNCYHVVVAFNVTNTAVLDGVTITAGNANATGNGAAGVLRNDGGGLNISGAQPIIRNCVISANASTHNGGGMLTSTSAPTIANCTFTANSVTASDFASGGAIAFFNSSSATITSCAFSDNSATGSGTVTAYGGAISLFNSSSAAITGCAFSGNRVVGYPSSSTGAYGGAIENYVGCTLTLDECRFISNSGLVFSGGGALENRGSLTANKCVFADNMAGIGAASPIGTGGAFQNAGSNAAAAAFTNCVFSGNQANGTGDDGGGAICVYAGSVTLKQCTLWANTTTSSYNATGNTISALANTTVTVVNSILWGTAAQVFNAGTTTITYSDVKCGYAGTGNLNADPSFVNAASPAGADGTWGTADDGLALQACSPALNAGTTPAPAIAADYLGSARAGAYDLGGYEYQGTPTPAALATASAAYTAAVCSSTTFGDCTAVVATVAATGTSPVAGSLTARVYVQGTTPTYNRQPYVRRTYDLAPAANANTATATLTLYFTQADFTNYNASRGTWAPLPVDGTDAAGYRANLRISQAHGTSATGLPGSYTWTGTGPASVLITPTAVAYNTALARWEVTFPVTGFSGFFVTTNALAPLPVELLDFTAHAENRTARLAWTTASEKNSARFEVERSPDGLTFAKIGEVAAAGNSTAARTYAYRDAAAPAGQLYYRLRQVDLDGSMSYSPVRTVTLGGPNALTLAPNPTQARTLASGLAPGAAVDVFDALGRPVLHAQADATGQAPLVLPAGLAPGLYVVRSGGHTARLVLE